MDQELLQKIEEQNQKIDAIYRGVEKTRKYILWSFVFNVAIFLLPIIGLIITIPWFLKVISSSYTLL